MVWWEFPLWMLPWIGIAIAVLYAGYVAYDAARVREEKEREPAFTGPDPALELERINTEIARLATQTRQSLESARESMRKGLKG